MQRDPTQTEESFSFSNPHRTQKHVLSWVEHKRRRRREIAADRETAGQPEFHGRHYKVPRVAEETPEFQDASSDAWLHQQRLDGTQRRAAYRQGRLKYVRSLGASVVTWGSALYGWAYLARHVYQPR